VKSLDIYKPISNYEILDFMKNEPNFIGVFSHDTLPILNNPISTTSLIVNYNNSNEAGSHWVATYGTQFYDSFGVIPSDIIQKWIRTTYKIPKGHIEYVEHQQQKIESSLCGFYCMFFIKKRNEGYSYDTIVHKMLDYNTDTNQELIKEFYKTLL